MSTVAEAAAAAQSGLPPDSTIVPCQSLHALEVLVIGDNDAPLAGITLELRDGTRALRARTAWDGLARFEGLMASAYVLCPYQLDVDAWTIAGQSPLPPALAGSSVGAEWEAPVPELADSNGEVHAVSSGEGVDRLALAHGLFPDTLWSHPRNDELRSRRESRNVLRANDQIFIPPIQRRAMDVAVAMRYVLRRRGVPSRLRVRLLDDLRPLAGTAWTLKVEGEPTAQGTTEPDGILEAWVPATASSAVLSFVSGGETREAVIALGALVPAREPGGWRQRMRNLGFSCDAAETGPLSAEDRGALARFQVCWGLPVTGEADAVTVGKIHAVHDGARTEAPTRDLYGREG